ncbi:hypothetical protein RhiirA5_433118 [Rhizophagus irregularis]|uniref:Uncharacterized protein n=1 Tax=Rhizophagus irregularis TaxID=588596 RepID=A0A2N0NSA2_9GLOM|nr:hypothetical protein RhiirA5_433118 [Rhizophagus irregularis]
MEETLKQYLNEYYRGFTGFELEHIEDFTKCLKEYKKFNLEEYEISHLDKDMLFPLGDIKIGVRDARTTKGSNIYKDILMDIAIFTMKMGGENVKRILETILLENSQASRTTQDEVTTDKEKGATTNEEEEETTEDKEIKRKNFLKSYTLEFYKDFKGFEEHHIDDFTNAIRKNSRVNLAEYEPKYMERDLIFRPGIMGEGIVDGKRRLGNDIIKDNLMDFATFTMKLAAETTKKLLDIVYETLQKRSAEKNAAIDDLEKEKKIANERIRSLENEVIKLQESEKKKTTSENTISSKPESKTKSHDRRRKSKKKKSSTQEIKKGKITEIPVQTTSDNDYLKKHFSERSRDLKFYDFPAYWKDNEIYDSLKQVGYIESLECKWNYKYRTVRARIRLTKEMEEIFVKGGSNIAIKKKDQYYFFRMFDAKMSTTDIKKRYEWQAYKKFIDLPGRSEYEGIKAENSKYAGHFSKIIKINKIKYILIYFNNESDLLRAIYKSTMEEDNMENGLKIKSQDELISENGSYKKRFGINKFDLPQKPKDGFVDAPTDLISTIPRSSEEHEELDNLNNNFKERLEELKMTTTATTQRKGKKKVTELSDNDVEEMKNENKKRVVRKQGERENSDIE